MNRFRSLDFPNLELWHDMRVSACWPLRLRTAIWDLTVIKNAITSLSLRKDSQIPKRMRTSFAHVVVRTQLPLSREV